MGEGGRERGVREGVREGGHSSAYYYHGIQLHCTYMCIYCIHILEEGVKRLRRVDGIN